jgi:hypothetical protein
MWERSAGNVLIGKSEGKRLIGGRRRRWENNIKIDLAEIGSRVVGRDSFVQNMDQ